MRKDHIVGKYVIHWVKNMMGPGGWWMIRGVNSSVTVPPSLKASYTYLVCAKHDVKQFGGV